MLEKRQTIHASTAHFGKWDHRYDENSRRPNRKLRLSDRVQTRETVTGGSEGTGGPAGHAGTPNGRHGFTDKALHFIDESHASGDKPFLTFKVSHYAVHSNIFLTNDETRPDVEAEACPPGKKHNMPEFAAMTIGHGRPASERVLDKLIRT